MKIYTKTGDGGFTSLFGGSRISKDDIRIEAYGTIDELNAFVGSLHDVCTDKEVRKQLFIIQNKLFNIGSVLASDPEKDFKLKGVDESDIQYLESCIDAMDERLAVLKNFILASGHVTISAAHICRTVCRRAERRVVSLHNVANGDEKIIQYLNRLSDYFFTLARYLAILSNVDEVKWDASI